MPDHTPEGMWPKQGRPELPPLQRSDRGIPKAYRLGFCGILQRSGGEVGVVERALEQSGGFRASDSAGMGNIEPRMGLFGATESIAPIAASL